MFGPAAAAPGAGWPPSSLITISRPRPKWGPQRKSTGCGVEIGLLGKLDVAGYDQQVVLRAGLLPIAVNGDFPDELPAHQPADLRPAEVQGRVELEHGPVGGFEDDRLAEPLVLVFRRAIVEEDDGARMDLDPPVGEVAVLLKEQHGAVALQDRRVLQFPRAGRKEGLIRSICWSTRSPRGSTIAAGDCARRRLARRLGRRLDPGDRQQRVRPVGDQHDRKTPGDAAEPAHRYAWIKSSQRDWALRINSTVSRIAPAPPPAAVT